MPGQDGYALLAAMRKGEHELGDIPAIALTVYATRDDRIRILCTGFQTARHEADRSAELVVSSTKSTTAMSSARTSASGTMSDTSTNRRRP